MTDRTDVSSASSFARKRASSSRLAEIGRVHDPIVGRGVRLVTRVSRVARADSRACGRVGIRALRGSLVFPERSPASSGVAAFRELARDGARCERDALPGIVGTRRSRDVRGSGLCPGGSGGRESRLVLEVGCEAAQRVEQRCGQDARDACGHGVLSGWGRPAGENPEREPSRTVVCAPRVREQVAGDTGHPARADRIEPRVFEGREEIGGELVRGLMSTMDIRVVKALPDGQPIPERPKPADGRRI